MKRLEPWANQTIDSVSAQIRLKFLDEWRKRTIELGGNPGPDGIDYSIPEIHVQFLLCDPTIQYLGQHKKHRDQFNNLFSADECEYL